MKNFSECPAKYIACLPPATDESIFKPIDVEKKFDFSLFGHIPKPWNKKELNRIVAYKDSTPVYFKSIIPNIESALTSQDNPFISKNNQFSFKLFQEKYLFKFNPNLCNSIQYDITTRIFRQRNRLNYLNLIKKTSTNLSIYGTNWEDYPEFIEYYKGYISSPQDINKAIQESKIMLHDNHNLHFRVLDAMINGTPVAMSAPRKVNDNLELFGLKKDIHYLEVDIFNQKVFQLPSDKHLETISINAMKLIKRKHLWRHRAQTIINNVLHGIS